MKLFLLKFTVYICYAFAFFMTKRTQLKSFDQDEYSSFLDKSKQSKKIKVAIIDDEEFIYKDALTENGYSVTYFNCCTSKKSKGGVRLIDFESFDIIICDIHNVGTELYPGTEGLSVVTELRKRFPFHVIAIYTGNPGATHKLTFDQKSVDKVFVRDWSFEDIQINLDELRNIFNKPSYRWEFLKRRFDFLKFSDDQILEIRRTFTRGLLTKKYLSFFFKRFKIVKKFEPNTDITALISKAQIESKGYAIFSNVTTAARASSLLSL